MELFRWIAKLNYEFINTFDIALYVTAAHEVDRF